MKTTWESELAELLAELLALQEELLQTLKKKHELLAAVDADGLAELAAEEERLIAGLRQFMRRRQTLLSRARHEGLPSASIRALAQSLPRAERDQLRDRVQLARSRARLLQHRSLTNWVVVQRTLIHLSQVLEIIATGGRLQPTYGKGEPAHASGALVDRAA